MMSKQSPAEVRKMNFASIVNQTSFAVQTVVHASVAAHFPPLCVSVCALGNITTPSTMPQSADRYPAGHITKKITICIVIMMC